MGKRILPNQKKKADRNINDNYITPCSIVQQLLDTINIDKTDTIYEPCASHHLTIGQTLAKNGYENVTNNIYDPADPATDFLSQQISTNYIITNTPYGDKSTTEFILHMKRSATKGIMALYPLSILQGIKRYNIIWTDTEFPLKEVLLFVRPPLLTDTPTDNYKTGMTFYAWFIWVKGYKGEVVFRHLNNHTNCIGYNTNFINC